MASEAFLVLVNVPPTDWTCRIGGGRKTVGRSSHSAIRIPNRYLSVSRRHAEVFNQGPELWIRDLASRGGTQLNGVWLHAQRPAKLTIGDRVTLSDIDLDVVAEVPPLAAVIADSGIAFDSSSSDDTSVQAHSSTAIRDKLRCLTPAELEVVLWMCRGTTDDNELARVLFRSPHTIRTQVGNILQKLELHSRISILNWLKRAGAASRGAASRGAVMLDEEERLTHEMPTPTARTPHRTPRRIDC